MNIQLGDCWSLIREIRLVSRAEEDRLSVRGHCFQDQRQGVECTCRVEVDLGIAGGLERQRVAAIVDDVKDGVAGAVSRHAGAQRIA